MTDMNEQMARAMAERNEPGIWDRPEGPPDEFWRDGYLNDAKAAREAYENALEEQGLVIVPREPTNRMIEELYGEFIGSIAHQARIDGYKDMIAALEGKE